MGSIGNDPILSVYITTFNHGKYIQEALNSVLMQNTNYKFEVLIGDDCSEDNTVEILKEFEKQHQGRLKVIYREKNMGARGANNMLDLIKKCKGKYLIALEGDDFWIDSLKLDKQITFLENHPEYIAVSHNCVVVDELSNKTNELYPECKQNEYSLKYLASNIMPGQLTTVMYRNIFKNSDFDTSIMEYGLMPADRLLYFVLSSYGTIYCIQETMSAYRHIISNGSSFSANYSWKYSIELNWYTKLRDYASSLRVNKESLKYAELMLMRVIIGSRKRCGNNWFFIISELKRFNFPVVRYFEYMKQLFNRKILHLDVWA